MKNYSEIEKQLDSGDPIVKEVFLTLLSNLNEAYHKTGQGFNDEAANIKFFEALDLFTEEMRKNGFLGPAEYLFDSFWRGLHWLLLERS